MDNLEFTIKKIESLSNDKPSEETYKYLFTWLDQWRKEGSWWHRLFKYRLKDMKKQPIYRAVLVTLGRIGTDTAVSALAEFYQPSNDLDDRENIKRAVIAFFNKQYYHQPIDHLDFQKSDDRINISVDHDEAKVVYTRVINSKVQLPFTLILKKIKSLWLVYSLNEKS